MGMGLDIGRGVTAVFILTGIYVSTWAYYKYSARKLDQRVQLLNARVEMLEREQHQYL